MMAKRFAKYSDIENVVIFASGVANSKEVDENAFQREYDLVEKTLANNSAKHFVYFGTSSMYDPASKNSLYVTHKLSVEEYIKKNSSLHSIFRVSQIIAPSNKYTLANYIVDSILQNKNLEVWSLATRNLIALDDVYSIVDYMLNANLAVNKTVNVANPSNIPILEFIEQVEKALNKKANLIITPKGAAFDEMDVSSILPVAQKLGINFSDEDYYINAIIKAYGQN
jgi:nucleoside-diphosphate-sugar epimerase